MPTDTAKPVNALATVIQQSGLAEQPSAALLEAFQPFFDEAATLAHAAKEIKVTDATQVTEMKAARTTRLALKAVRVSAEQKRVALKAEYLKMGQAIDRVAGVVKGQIEPVESALEDMEKFAERAEAARIARLNAERSAALAPYADPINYPGVGAMPAGEWDKLLVALRTAHEQRVDAERKAQAEREAAEKARREEEARIRAENERLRKEAEAREAEVRAERERAAVEAQAAAEKARKEREAVEAEARKEREAREALEWQEKARKAEEDRKDKEAAAAKRRAERAPDREKLAALALALRAIPTPSITDSSKATCRRCMNIIATAAGAIDELLAEAFT